MNEATYAFLTLVGLVLIVIGVSMIYSPAAYIAAGILLTIGAKGVLDE